MHMNVSGTITKSLSGLMNVPELWWSIVRLRAAGFQDGTCASDGRFGTEQTEEFGKRQLMAMLNLFAVEI